MSEIKISESSLKNKNILYLYKTLGDLAIQLNAKVDVKNGKNRCEYRIEVPKEHKDLFLVELEDKMADIIAVNYKYAYFKKNIKLGGLKQIEKELLLTALISADIVEDKKYVIRRLKCFDEYSIDGIFHFRMKPLKEKWEEIVGYVPTTFSQSQLKDFISYLIKDKNSKRVYVEKSGVYDKRFNLLRRSDLMAGDSGKCLQIKEILLSNAGVVEMCTPLVEDDERYIKEFYGDRTVFNESYFD